MTENARFGASEPLSPRLEPAVDATAAGDGSSADDKPSDGRSLHDLVGIFNQLPLAAIVHDMQGRILEVNPRMLVVYRVTRDQALQSTIGDLTAPPVDWPRLQEIWRRVQETGSMEFEWMARTVNMPVGFTARVHLSAITWGGEPAILAAVQDISDQKRMEAQLLESERKYHLLFEHMGHGFALHDIITNEQGRPVDYRFLDMNPAYTRMTGLSWDACIGRTVRDLLPRIEPYWIETFGRVALTGESINYTNYAQDLGRHYDVTAFCPQVGQFAVLVEDVTEKVEQRETLRRTVNDLEEANAELEDLNQNLEQIVGQRTADLKAANEALEARMVELQQTQGELIRSEKLASIGELVAGIAHEINTPLGVGVTAASFLDSSIDEVLKADTLLAADPGFRKITTKWKDTARIILSNMERAARLVKSFKQVSVDRTSDPRRDFRLRDYIDEVLVSLHPMIKRSGSRAVNEVPEEIVVTGYPGALSQVVTNLVTNAIRHAFPDDRKGTMTITATVEEAHVSLSFQDDGVGIPSENRGRIFDPFFSTRKDSGGSGLGLFIIQNLVANRMRGSITCLPVPTGGTEFIIRFPVEVQEMDEPGQEK